MDVPDRNRKQTGGLVLKREEIEEILNKPGTQGLAFAVKEPGKAPNVDLTVLQVFEKEGILQGEEHPVSYKVGAPSPLRYPATSVKDYKFKNRKKLKEDGFSFGYFSKDAFEALFMNEGFDEVFLGGGEKDYGSIDLIEGDQAKWFTLAISIRRSLGSIISNNGNRGIASNSAQATQRHTLPLNDFTGQPNVSASTLRKIAPNIFDQDLTVKSLLLDEESSQVQGLVVETTEGIQEITFDSERPVRNIMLNLDGGIRRIDFEEEEIEDQVDEQEMVKLGNMFMNHIEPCPPHWYRGLSSRGGEIKTFLESIIK